MLRNRSMPACTVILELVSPEDWGGPSKSP
jgi:hypothetical protein